jgi:hypothetical protein
MAIQAPPSADGGRRNVDQEYGDGVNKAAVQSAGSVGATASPAPQAGGMTPPPPGSLTPLLAPSGRPDEPITNGLSTGPGAGPEALLPGVGGADDALWELRALAEKFPSRDLSRIIAIAESRL